MKINNINQNINFGYNKEYHEYVKEYLQERKYNKQIADAFIQADEFLMQVEDSIVELETSKKYKSNKYLGLVDMFQDLKRTLAYNIETYFPALGYSENEISTYLDENRENPIVYDDVNWRIDLSKDLQTFTPYQFEELKLLTESKDPIKKYDAKPTEEEVSNAVSKHDPLKAQNDKQKSFVTLFEPTKSSPKGFSSVVGMDELKTKFQEQIIDYIIHPENIQLDYEQYGISAPRGFLLYGPPGCGKTFITQALATEAGMKLYMLDISKVGSIYVNETSNNIDNAFNEVIQVAKSQDRPVLLFLDEFDSIGITREGSRGGCNEDLKATDTLLKFIQNAQDNNIIIIGATNRYDLLDEAIAQRFDEQAYIGLPDKKQRLNLIKSELAKRSKASDLLDNEDLLLKLADKFSGFSTRSIVFILNQASNIAKRNNRDDIKYSYVVKAIDETDQQKVNEDKYKKVQNHKIGFNN